MVLSSVTDRILIGVHTHTIDLPISMPLLATLYLKIDSNSKVSTKADKLI